MDEIQVVRLHRMDGETKLKAFCDLSVGDFVVKGLTVMEGKNGLFVSMPRRKARDGKWYDIIFPVTAELRRKLSELVLSAYAV